MRTYECCICLEDYEPFKSLRCEHSFHPGCLGKYINKCKPKSKKAREQIFFSCPLCKDEQQVPISTRGFIEKLPTSDLICLSCEKRIPVESIIYKHDGHTLGLSTETPKKIIDTIEKEMRNQEEEFKEYRLWANEQKKANLDAIKNYALDLISQVIEWKKNYCDAIEMYVEKDLKNLEKLSSHFQRCMEDKKLSIPKSTTEICNVALLADARVDLRARREESTDFNKILPGFNPRNILTSVLPSTINLSQAMEKFKDPSEIPRFPEKTEEKTSVDVKPSVCSETESVSQKEMASATNAGSDYECISDFEVNPGKICRANILPNDTILVCSEDPNKLEMYDLKGRCLSIAKLNDIPEDMMVWKNDQLIICYHNSSFELVTFENNDFTHREVLKTPRSYDSISSLKPGYMIGKYDKNKCDVLKVENGEFKSIKTCYLRMSNVRRVHGSNQYIFYCGCNDGLMPNQINRHDRKTKDELCLFPAPTSCNLSPENIKDFTVNARLLFFLDSRRHKVYGINRSRADSSTELLSEVDGIQNPFCVDINDSEHLLVCYNSMKEAKIKVFNIEQAVATLS